MHVRNKMIQMTALAVGTLATVGSMPALSVQAEVQSQAVSATVASTYTVTIPAGTIPLNGATKTAEYNVSVEFDIASDEDLQVVPDETFNMSDVSGGEKADVTASVTQEKTLWHWNDVTTTTTGTITADGLTSGEWEGTLNFTIDLVEATAVDRTTGLFSAAGTQIASWDAIEEAGLLTIDQDGVLSQDEEQYATFLSTYELGSTTDCSLVIPDGVTVLNSSFTNMTILKSVTVPDGVTAITGDTFNGCTNLASVNVPSGVTTIGGYAFLNCANLTTLSLPSSVTTIGIGAFSGCAKLESISIPEGVTTIGKNTFEGCTSLTTVSLPSTLTTIGDEAFSNCNKLATCDIPSGVTSIGVEAFYKCFALTSVTVPGGVTAIPEKAFYRCEALASVTIAEGVESIGERAFYHCEALSSLSLPDTLTTISAYAFYDCDALESVTIPDTVTTIGAYAFYDAKKLASVTLPSGLTSVGTGALRVTPSSASFVYKGTTYTSDTEGLMTALAEGGVTDAAHAFDEEVEVFAE